VLSGSGPASFFCGRAFRCPSFQQSRPQVPCMLDHVYSRVVRSLHFLRVYLSSSTFCHIFTIDQGIQCLCPQCRALAEAEERYEFIYVQSWKQPHVFACQSHSRPRVRNPATMRIICSKMNTLHSATSPYHVYLSSHQRRYLRV
jgi:hypothetical protein